ncbi:hypothetical protein LOD99_21 [Oopsacas minuta]|uniref:EF-hand domain-containing protein n=1 Tax=Oopsacas minuta TaxID=111878 RepID=A0AAV7K826_9METZ|nr:hypothetical protein LOD99_21 [Oopsacas minuta]
MNTTLITTYFLLLILTLTYGLPNEKQIKEEIMELGKKQYDNDPKKMFTAFDRNKNGKLEDAEVRVLLQESGGYKWTLKIVTDRLIHTLDKDGDHAVSYDEIPFK